MDMDSAFTRSDTVVLQPVAMRQPNGRGIYAPSRLRSIRVIALDEFLKKYADRPCRILVSFESDGVSDPQPITGYGFCVDCWYILWI